MARSNYQRSNAILNVECDVTDYARFLTGRILNSSEEGDRQKFAQALLDELTDCAQIDIVNIKVSSARQYHKKRGNRIVFKRYGYYRPKSKYIYISNRTAVLGKILAPKTFLDTLLHEWMHHYDCVKLNLNSIHTKGFYTRLGKIKTALL